jgi:hypothetical protein
VSELWPRCWQARAAPLQDTQPYIERDPAECDDHLDALELANLGFQMIEAAGDFLRLWCVIWRRTSHRGDDVSVIESEAIVDVTRGCDVGEARALERRHEEIA